MLELRKRKQQLFFSSATLELWDWNDSIDVCLLICLRAIRWSWNSQLLNVAWLSSRIACSVSYTTRGRPATLLLHWPPRTGRVLSASKNITSRHLWYYSWDSDNCPCETPKAIGLHTGIVASVAANVESGLASSSHRLLAPRTAALSPRLAGHHELSDWSRARLKGQHLTYVLGFSSKPLTPPLHLSGDQLQFLSSHLSSVLGLHSWHCDVLLFASQTLRRWLVYILTVLLTLRIACCFTSLRLHCILV